MHKSLILFICCFIFPNVLLAQHSDNDSLSRAATDRKGPQRKTHKATSERPYGYLGIGAGLDFGGIGVRAEFPIINFLSIFGGAGYNLAGIGGNAGLLFKALPDKFVRPTVACMYGYNAVIIEKPSGFYGSSLEKKTVYSGITAGGGLEVDFGRKKRNKFGLLVLLPFRSGAFYRDAERTKTNLPPVGLSLGLHFGM